MQTPSWIGAQVTYPRTKFAYLDDWTHVGMVFTLRKNGLIGSIQFRVDSSRPGLRLWLDDLFFTEVTDLPQDKVKELLGDAEFKPIKSLPFRKDMVDGSPPQKGNMLWNAGFEFVSNGAWGRPAHRFTAADFTTDNPHSGKRALVLKHGSLLHMPLPLKTYKQHTFSVYARSLSAETRGKMELRLTSYGGGYRYQKKFDVGPEWKRFSVGSVPMPVPGSRYYLLLIADNVAIDDAQLEEGDATEYAPRCGVEAALSMDARAYIYEWGKSVPLNVHFANTGKNDLTTEAQVRVWDIFGKAIYSQKIPLRLAPGARLEKTLHLPDNLRGAFCADICAGEAVLAERVFSVLPEPRDIPAEDSMMGDHLNFSEFNMWAARRMGTRWTRTHDGFCKIFKMYRIQPKPGEWDWKSPLAASVGPDEAVLLAKKHGIKIVGLLDEPPGWAVGLPGKGRCRGAFPEDWNAWLKYVNTIVTRYKGYIDTWELYNEPSNLEKYVELCEKTYAEFKKTLPKARLIGLSGTPNAPMCKGFAAMHGERYLDAVTTHIYAWSPKGNLGANFRQIHKLFRKDGRPMEQWMTEGNMNGTRGVFFRSHPAYEPTRRDVACISRYLTVARACNVTRVFYYWSNYPSPRPQDPVGGNGWSFYHYDTSLTPGGAAWAVWAAMLDGARPLATLVDRDEEVYLFKDGKELVATVWAETPKTISLPADVMGNKAACRRFDVMGNETRIDLSKPHELSIGRFMYYFRFSNAGQDDVLQYFRKGLALPENWQVRRHAEAIKEEQALP